jgi:tRNA-Thr(GGU) m(6)t(6)A37 methyltransferase TsaA
MQADQVVFRAVGVVRTAASDDEVREKRDDSERTVEVYPDFEEALDGLDGFSHIFVLSYLNRLRPEQVGPLKVKPRRLLKAGVKLEELPLVGVFAIDSPTRPNPIGLSLVRLVRREGRRLVVSGLDLFDGTPVLDIKPHREDYRAERFAVAEWHRRIVERVGKPA